MNPSLGKLQPYPFQKLAELKQGTRPPSELEHIALSIGEPKHPTPELISNSIIENIAQLSSYPTTKGRVELRQTILDWLSKRFNLPENSLHADKHILPVNGTREALFAIVQAVIKPAADSLVLMPNPFYQIYEGATYLAGSTPYFLSCTQDNGYLPDYDAVPDEIWDKCQLLFICSPANPTGAVTDADTLKKLINLAEKHDFIIASDECYSEIYLNEEEPPVGLLEAAAEMGNDSYKRCLVFHSLSKRSNSPGLRSGFVAGDAEIIDPFFQYRTYHGCAMPGHHQLASIHAWQDEQHVKQNRDDYRAKFNAVYGILKDTLNVQMPEAGFYLWPETPISDLDFAKGLYDQQNLTVLPGSFLSREVEGKNPGNNRIRLALVAELDECIQAAERIKQFTESLN